MCSVSLGAYYNPALTAWYKLNDNSSTSSTIIDSKGSYNGFFSKLPFSVNYAWAPEFFTDADGLHILVAAATPTFKFYDFTPISSDLSTWRNNGYATIGGGTNTIDPFMVKIGSTYSLWYVDQLGGSYSNSIQYATNSSLLGTYTQAKNADWSLAQFGYGREGECLVQLDDGNWRIYFEPVLGAVTYSNSTDNWNTWTAPNNLIITGITNIKPGHGSVIINSHPSYKYIMASHGLQGSTPQEKLYIWTSDDGITWACLTGNYVYSAPEYVVRDPSIIRYDNKYYVCYTNNNNDNIPHNFVGTRFGVASSTDLIHWTHVAWVEIAGASTSGNSVAGNNGRAISFNGTDEHIKISNVTAFKTANKTISFWAKPTDNITSLQGIFSLISANYYVAFYSNNRMFYSYSNAASAQVTGAGVNNAVKINEWHMYTYVFRVIDNNVTVTLYVDNALSSTNTLSTGYGSSYGNSAVIGAFNGGSLFYKGCLDNIRVYNTSLSAADVSALYSGDIAANWFDLDFLNGWLTGDSSFDMNDDGIVNFIDYALLAK